MTDNEKTVLEKLYDELRAELSTTQLNCDMWHDRAEDMRNRLSVAQAENAELRKLMRIMAYCNQSRRDCDGCSMNGAAGIITEHAGCDELLARLRELGVDE